MNLFNQIASPVNQIYKIGDESTAAEIEKRIIQYDIIKLPTTESDGRSFILTKEEAMTLTTTPIKRRAESIMSRLLRPGITMETFPFVLELHVSAESNKMGMFRRDIHIGRISDLMVIVAEVVANFNGVEIKFINDDFDAVIKFIYQ